MKPGRKPTPTTVLAVRGSWRAKVRPAEGAYPALDNDRPAWLDNLDAVDKWNELYPRLSNLGVLKATDGDCLARYCFWYGEFMNSSDIVMKMKIDVLLGRLGACLGLSPADRVRVQATPAPGKKDKFLRMG